MMRLRAPVSRVLSFAPARAEEALRPYEVVGDAIPKSLTGEPGDPERGRGHRGQAGEHVPAVPLRARSRSSASRAICRPI